VPVPGTDDKFPYSCLTVNGTLNATGVTFTTIPDGEGETAWKDAGWQGIIVESVDSTNAAGASFDNCVFKNSKGEGTLRGVDSNVDVDGQTVNITVKDCVFEDPVDVGSEFAAAISYNNGYHRAGKGTLNVSGTTITGYNRGIRVWSNQRDEIDISIDSCTFNNIAREPVRLESGRSAVLTDCIFNDIKSGMECVAEIFASQNETSDTDQTVTISGNTFNGDATTDNYPIVVGANAKINENVEGAPNTFNETYPTAYRYISFYGGIGSIGPTNPSVEHAVWGYAGTPYLLYYDVKVSDNGTENDGIYSSLVIKPGVTVNFAAHKGLNIDGALTAEGGADKHITFQRIQDADWCFGLGAGGDLEGPISLEYCDFVDLNSGININSPSTATAPPTITIENCTIQSVNYQTALKGKNITVNNSSFTGAGVDLSYGGNIALTDCTITMNAGSFTENGVKIENCDTITLQGCDITSNGSLGGDGVYINNSKSVVLKNCLVAKFPDFGVSLNQNPYATIGEGAPLIENCTIVSNGYGGAIFKYSHNAGSPGEYSPFIKNSIITNNGVNLPADDPKLDIIRLAGYKVTIPEGSISYSLIGTMTRHLALMIIVLTQHYMIMEIK